MQRLKVGALVAPVCLLIAGTAVPARALVIAPPPPGPQKMGQADTVVVGRVMAILDKDVQAAPAPGAAQTIAYRIAIVRVTDALKGAQGKETIRVGWPAPPQGAQPNPGGPVRPPIGRPRFGVNLEVGADGLFYLTKHHKEDFYTLPMYYSFSSSQNPKFKEEVETARKTIKLLADPIKALKSTDAQERLLAASAMITKYRTPRPGAARTQPIPAEESKLILAALQQADWKQPNRFGETNAMQLFNQLGITQADGWTPPRPQPGRNYQEDFANAAQEWLRRNRDTYRIQGFVSGAEER
jgi:hypothetical protein